MRSALYLLRFDHLRFESLHLSPIWFTCSSLARFGCSSLLTSSITTKVLFRCRSSDCLTYNANYLPGNTSSMNPLTAHRADPQVYITQSRFASTISHSRGQLTKTMMRPKFQILHHELSPEEHVIQGNTNLGLGKPNESFKDHTQILYTKSPSHILWTCSSVACLCCSPPSGAWPDGRVSRWYCRSSRLPQAFYRRRSHEEHIRWIGACQNRVRTFGW